jgi:hypothetical protein
VRSYHKPEVDGHRVELELHPRFLSGHGIQTTNDFVRFANILPQRHIWFARFSEQRLTQAMSRHGFNRREIDAIRREVNGRAGNLWDALHFLRQQGLTNSRRSLVPVSVNASVRKALQYWAALWRLEGRSGEN